MFVHTEYVRRNGWGCASGTSKHPAASSSHIYNPANTCSVTSVLDGLFVLHMPWDGQLLKSTMTTVAAVPDETLTQTIKGMVIKERGGAKGPILDEGAGRGEGEGEDEDEEEGEHKAPVQQEQQQQEEGAEGSDGLLFVGDLVSIAERELAADAYSRYCVLDSLVGWAQRFAEHAAECEALCQELQGMGRTVEGGEGDVGMEDERIEIMGVLSAQTAAVIEFLMEVRFGERAAQVRAMGTSTSTRLSDLVEEVIVEQPADLTTTLDTLSEDVYEVSRARFLSPAPRNPRPCTRTQCRCRAPARPDLTRLKPTHTTHTSHTTTTFPAPPSPTTGRGE